MPDYHPNLDDLADLFAEVDERTAAEDAEAARKPSAETVDN